MGWTDFFIKRPVFSIALSLLLVCAGLFAFKQLPLRLFPNVENPLINIQVNYPGANAKTVQDFVTNVLETSLTGIKGVNYIRSFTTQGSSEIDVHMQMGVNADAAMTDVMQKVASVRDRLPQDVQDPVIEKQDDNDNPISILAFTSTTMSRPQISDYVARMVINQLESIDGVAQAKLMGNRYAMRIWLDPNRLAAYHLTPQDVMTALKNQNIQSAPGSIQGKTSSYNLIANTDLSSPQQFDQVIIKNKNGVVVTLSDVGKAILGNESYNINAYFDGKPADMVFIKPQPGANPLTVVHDLHKLLPNIEKQMPAGMHVKEMVNAATFINASIHEVVSTIIESIIIVAIVIFLFIGSLRAVLIPLITIPIALIGVCFVLMLMGFSINMLTLLAMVIAIGLVVDDAIVVMENIHRYMEKGHSALQASLIGTRQIAFTVIAMTLTLAAIFAPIAFSSGITGQLFSEFIVSLAGAVIISGIAALTLTPMMCSKIMDQNFSDGKMVHLIDHVFAKVKACYASCLHFTMRHKKWFIGFWMISLLACGYFYHATPQEIAPKEDQGFLQIIGSAPDSTSSQFVMKNSQQLNSIYRSFPDIQHYIYINGIPSPHQVLSFVKLKPWSERNVSVSQFQAQLQGALNKMAGLQMSAMVPPSLPGMHDMPIDFVIKSIGSYQGLYSVSRKILKDAKQSGLFLFINSDLTFDQPTVKVDIDREAAAAMNVNIPSITSSLSGLLSEGMLQYFNMSGQIYEVIPQSYASFRALPSQINNIQVRSESGALVPLSSLVTLSTHVEPETLNQFQKYNAVSLTAVMMPGKSMSQGLAFLQQAAKKDLKAGMLIDYAGSSRQFIQEGSRMLWLFFASFVVIFIVLSMQFESFRDPLIILLGSVPMALAAALLPLYFGASTINIYTQIGLLTLAGLISKHGIMMVKFANTLKQDGMDEMQAIITAATIRLRPVLMTTLAIVFGAMPLVFSSGASSVSRFDIGIVIACGMFLGTCCTLFVLPVLYTLLTSRTTPDAVIEKSSSPSSKSGYDLV